MPLPACTRSSASAIDTDHGVLGGDIGGDTTELHEGRHRRGVDDVPIVAASSHEWHKGPDAMHD